MVHGRPIHAAAMGLAAAYGIAYVAAPLVGAIWIFQYRDFKYGFARRLRRGSGSSRLDGIAVRRS